MDSIKVVISAKNFKARRNENGADAYRRSNKRSDVYVWSSICCGGRKICECYHFSNLGTGTLDSIPSCSRHHIARHCRHRTTPDFLRWGWMNIMTRKRWSDHFLSKWMKLDRIAMTLDQGRTIERENKRICQTQNLFREPGVEPGRPPNAVEPDEMVLAIATPRPIIWSMYLEVKYIDSERLSHMSRRVAEGDRMDAVTTS
jgi:hypothetical protein